MRLHRSRKLLIVVIYLSFGACNADPFTVGIAVGGGMALAGLYSGLDYIKCSYTECCKSNWIKPNMTGLERALENQLHGQHLVKDVLMKALTSHLRKSDPKKALVLSFHGWTGGGKNFVTKFIADHLYVNGMKSQFVHLFIATLHFPHLDQIDIYKDNLRAWIKGNISQCERSLFIFDEMDKMPLLLIDAIKPFIDFYEHIDGTNFRRAIFVFLSNTGGSDITKVALDQWYSGGKREDLTMKDLEHLISRGAFNEKGGLQYTSIIEQSLIDFYIPFLPLERKHVKLCIQDELRFRGNKITNELINKVADHLSYGPQNYQVYSKTGCKYVIQKVDLVLETDYYVDSF